MTDKYTKKEFLENITTLTSPFENIVNVNHNPSSPNEVLQAIKVRGVKGQPVPKVGEE